MSLIQQTVPGLYNGVSQQPASMRLPNQCEVQDNAVGDLVRGLTKRPPVEYVDTLDPAIWVNSLVHEINRDAQEQYLVFFTDALDKPIVIYDLIEGVERTVSYGYLDEDLNLSEDIGVKDYLTTGRLMVNAKHRVRVSTIADYSIVVNTLISPEMKSGYTSNVKQNIAVINVSNWYEKEITLEVDGSTVTLGASEENTVDEIANTITDELVQNSTWPGGEAPYVNRSGNLIRVWFYDNRGFTLDVPSPDIHVHFRTVPQYGDLWPAQTWPEGDTIQILQDTYGDNAKYYVESDGENWVETVGFSQQFRFDEVTMPHRLVRLPGGEFAFAPVAWEDKKVGDENSAPNPSFIDKFIQNVFFFQNRLGFLTDQGVVMSRADKFFDFWPRTALDVLDDDPIDIGVATTSVTVFREILTFNKNMVIRADTGQFVMSYAGGMLSPKTVSVDQSTHFTTIPRSMSTTTGSALYFVCPNQDNLMVREYFIHPDSMVEDAANVTKHIPTYIPYSDVVELRSAPAMDYLFLFSQEKPDTLFVFQYFWQGEEKVQSAWSQWVFADNIVGMATIQSNLYLVFNIDGTNILTKISLNSTPKDTIHVDKKVEVTGVYDDQADITVFELPWTDPHTDWMIIDPDTKLALNGVEKNAESSLVSVPGDFEEKDYYLGQRYEMLYELSPWFLRDDRGNSVIGTLKLRSVTVSFADSGFFRLKVKNRKTGNEEADMSMSGFKLGHTETGEASYETDDIRYSIVGESSNRRIQLVNDTQLSSTFQTLTYEGFFHTRAEVG